ncbi:class I SAM-dependent methyltransferase [Williamsia sp. 1138]|uniref:class I SAM-dependent methyltransferase n=1 Tax=Williamsia sp. 1138 TaxID=1903117 RepID=UPI001FEFC549|nr:class I SAM-dependent methyltransferase [Williamsia sp. 1138]
MSNFSWPLTRVQDTHDEQAINSGRSVQNVQHNRSIFDLKTWDGDSAPDSDRWNYNTHYYRLTDKLMPGTDSVLDFGCGEGMLARRLRARSARVVGIDPDEDSIRAAREQSVGDIDYICGDALEYPFESESFDAVVSVAVLHHIDAARGLVRMAELVRPGGTVIVIGCASSERPRDLIIDLASTVSALAVLSRHKLWKHPCPVVWPPPVTYREMKKLAHELLPGSRFRRHLLFRYSISWTKPV